MHLRLVINNTDDLSGGYSAIKDFDEAGGTIGSSESNTWQIVDRDGSIDPTHILISFIDNQFCFETSIKKGLFINKSRSAIPVGEKVQITDGDLIKIGRFDLTAFVDMSIDEVEALESGGSRWSKRFVSIGSLVDNDYEDDITASNFFESNAMQRPGKLNIRESMKKSQEVDPINLIEDSYESRSTNEIDPLKLISRDVKAERNIMNSKLGDIIDVKPDDETKVDIPDDLQPSSAFMELPKVKTNKTRTQEQAPLSQKDSQLDEEFDSYLENLADSARSASEMTQRDVHDVTMRDHYLGGVESEDDGELIDHVLLRPLCIALGLPIQKMSVPKANKFMTEVGEAVRTAITGLMQTHQRELSDKSHLAETHLHAIEDNPLRLNKNVDDVIKDLFLVNSPVHLSASSAISESLELIKYHEQASEVASEEALDAVLRALGPVALAKRFKKYKGHAPRSGNLDAWHWQMYQYYFNEIHSEQQGGLGRMFWEVYHQVYDREMREQTLES